MPRKYPSKPHHCSAWFTRRAPLALLVAGGLAACGPHYAKVDADRVQAVTVATDEGRTFCGNAGHVDLQADVIYSNGVRLGTGDRGDQRIHPSEIGWRVAIGQVDEDGTLWLPEDRSAWFDDYIEVTAFVRKRPDVQTTVEIAPRFNCGVADFDGADGYDGDTGANGGSGADGPNLRVELSYVDSEHNGRLVRVRVVGATNTDYYVDTRGPVEPFVVSARGGRGGDGGKGYEGADGDDGRDGHDGADGRDDVCEDGDDGGPGDDGDDGEDGGDGGHGGPGGRGGTIQVVYDAAHPELPGLIHFDVTGGDGGNGGDGGDGGRGGDGGDGGDGGRPGMDDPGLACPAVAGDDGDDGRDGYEGRDGRNGYEGEPGPDGYITARANERIAVER